MAKRKQGEVKSNASQYFSVQLDENLKQDFSDFCDATGLTMSAAICILVKQTIQRGQIPFRVEAMEKYTPAGPGRHSEKPASRNERLTIRMDRELQNAFADICDEIGITRSVIIRMFFMRCLNDNRLPFSCD